MQDVIWPTYYLRDETTFLGQLKRLQSCGAVAFSQMHVLYIKDVNVVNGGQFSLGAPAECVCILAENSSTFNLSQEAASVFSY